MAIQHGAHMNKRAAAAVLWFAAIWVGFEIVWSLTGVPRMIGPIVATAVSAFVGVDPHGLFWARSARPAVSPLASPRAISVEG